MGTDKIARQKQLEYDGVRDGIARYHTVRQRILNDKNRDNLTLTTEAAFLRQCVLEIEKRINLGLRGRGGGKGKTQHAKAALRNLPASRLAYLTLRFVFNITGFGGVIPIQRAGVTLGGQVQHDLEYHMFEQQAPGYLKKVEERLTTAHLRHRMNVLNHARKKVMLKDGQQGIPSLNWDDEMKFHVGKVLLDIVLKTTDMLEVRKHNSYAAGKRFGTQKALAISTKWMEKIDNQSELLADASPLHYPMIVPPKDWTASSGGGFLTNYKSLWLRLIKSRYNKRHEKLDEVLPQKVFDAVNKIQQTPFKINTKVLETLKYAADHAMGGLSPWERDANLPPKFWNSDVELKVIQQQQPEKFTAWKAECAQAYDQWHRETSKRVNVRMQISLAKRFKDEPELFFVWQLDWRGRLYPVQEYINPQGDDAARSLLLYSRGKRLGIDGSYWLAVHAANCWGEDKVSNNDREAWTLDNSDMLEAIAADPLSNRQWEEADKPFQFLAACFEWDGFLKEGYDFITHLPIQMDGTCSGLQHYAGMLRDEVGGAAVNLIPGMKPADVYAQGAEVAVEILKKHIREGGDEAQYAQEWLNVGVDRSVAKRNIMTVCYGATLRGFADQLDAYLKKKKKVHMFKDSFKACTYLAKVNWEAVSVLLVKARQAMDYLQDVARFIAKHDLEIHWTTPVGFPVIQDYLKTKTQRINTIFGGTRVTLNLKKDTKQKDTRRAANSVAPNLVHSFDSAHLMLTALDMAERGLKDFSFIHDSFGCHAPDVPVMAECIRDTFVGMYSVDRLQEWTDALIGQIPGFLRDELRQLADSNRPTVGGLDLTEVKRSAYFFN